MRIVGNILSRIVSIPIISELWIRLFEFFQLSEEIGAEPLPVLSCGLACQFQNSDAEAHAAVCDWIAMCRMLLI